MVKNKRKEPSQRVIARNEALVRAERLINANRELFGRLAGTSRGEITCAELAGDLIGSFQGGPADSSTNKRYLKEAILTDHFKHAAKSPIKRPVKVRGTTRQRPAKPSRRAKRG